MHPQKHYHVLKKKKKTKEPCRKVNGLDQKMYHPHAVSEFRELISVEAMVSVRYLKMNEELEEHREMMPLNYDALLQIIISNFLFFLGQDRH